MKYGLQLYSVRDAAEKDYEQTLAKVAEMGYSMVETAGFFGHSASEVREMAARHGLTICGTHTPGRALFEDFDATVVFHKELGCSDIIIPWADFSTAEKLDAFIEKVNSCIPLLKKEGLALHYHNHSEEFLPNKDGQIALLELMARTELMFEIDIFWAYNAGTDPVKFIEEHKDRITTVHLKDGIAADPDTDTRAQDRSLGEGDAPVAEVRKKAMELGLNIVVESESLSPTGLEEVKRCIDYLHTLDNN